MRTVARLAVLCGTTLIGGALGVLPASAHVTVHSVDATAGGYAELTFRVPTEKDNASTTKVQVNFPASTPLASVSVRPHPGWTFTVTNRKLSTPITTDDGKVTTAVSAITWTASAGQGIAPGEYDDFAVSAGPLPKSGSLSFPALQTYSDGSIVRWIEVAASGAPEPEHPAPSLEITAAPATQPSSSPTASAMDESMPGMQNTAKSSSSSSSGRATAALAIGVTALVIALAGVGLGVFRQRRPDGGS